MGFLKFLVVLASLIVGAVFLGSGVGAFIPILKYKEFEAKDIPIGIAFLAFGLAIAFFWKIKKVTEERYTERTRDPTTGVEKTTEIIKRSEKYCAPPSQRH